jgi:hypothetical protein
VETPHTGSTSVRAELCELYDGRILRGLHRHAYWSEFARLATPEQRRYFAFSCLRDPIDETVSLYFKLKTNHRGAFTDPSKLATSGGFVTPRQIERFRFVTENDATLSEYLARFCRIPYDNALRPARDGDWTRHFDARDRRRAVRVFGPFMAACGLPLPHGWESPVSLADRIAFRACAVVREAHWRWKAYRRRAPREKGLA